MALVVPPSVPGDGTTTVLWVPTLANPAAPKLTELTAASVLDISCYLSKDFAVEAEQETGEDERLCLVQTLETPGAAKYSIPELMIIADPQNPSSVSNKAANTLVKDLSGYLVVRYGKLVDTAFAVAQIVDVVAVTIGVQSKVKPEKNTPLRVKLKLFITGDVKQNVAVVA